MLNKRFASTTTRNVKCYRKAKAAAGKSNKDVLVGGLEEKLKELVKSSRSSPRCLKSRQK